MKVLFTSAGLETDALRQYFTGLLPKKPDEVKTLFVPTAADDIDSIMALPGNMSDLLKCGINGERIDLYNLQREMSYEELEQYDVVYLCGGDTDHLLERISDQGFDDALKQYVAADKVLVSVTPGVLEAQSLKNHLGLPNCRLYVLSDRRAS